MIRVVLSALDGLQLQRSYLVTRRPEIWNRAPCLEAKPGRLIPGRVIELNRSRVLIR